MPYTLNQKIQPLLGKGTGLGLMGFAVFRCASLESLLEFDIGHLGFRFWGCWFRDAGGLVNLLGVPSYSENIGLRGCSNPIL